MKNNVNERVREIISEKKLSSVFLAKLTGLNQTSVARQIKGTSNVSIELVYAILHNFPDVSATWLMMGEGGKYTLPQMTGEENEDTEDLLARIAQLTAERDSISDKLQAALEKIKYLEYIMELQKTLLHKSHEDNFIEEESKKEIV